MTHLPDGSASAPSASGAPDDDPIRLLAVREDPLSLDEVYAAVGDDAAAWHRPLRRHRA